MNIIVCIKQVPDTHEVKIDPEKGTLIRTGVPSIINPDDKAGLEAALALKDSLGAHVIVLTMGPLQAKEAIHEALAMGADEGILLTDRAFGGADTLATSTTLAAAIKKLDYDLIITGRQAIDGDTAQVGPQIAEHIGIPNISYVEDIKCQDNAITVKRQFEGYYQVIRCQLPCLITTLGELATPRYMTPKGIFDSYREKDITVWGVKDIDVDLTKIGHKGSPTKVKKSFTKALKGKGIMIQSTPQESAEWLVDRLKEKFII